MDIISPFSSELDLDRDREEAPSSSKHVKTLRAHYQEMVRLKIFENMSHTEIADRFGLSVISVSNALSSPIVKAYEKEVQGRREALFLGAEAALAELMPVAAETLAKVLSDETPVKTMDKVKVAQDVLDRAGLGKTTRTESFSFTTTLSSTEVEDIKVRARANASRRGLIINALPGGDSPEPTCDVPLPPLGEG